MIIKNRKGFLSFCVLLFATMFLGVLVSNRKDGYYSLLSVKLLDTKKQNASINFEEFVKMELKNLGNDPLELQQNVNQGLAEYLRDSESEDWFVLDTRTNRRLEANVNELKSISKTLVLKPAPNITLKRYTLTNGTEKNKYLSFELSTNCSKTIFSFPKNYSVEVIVYD